MESFVESIGNLSAQAVSLAGGKGANLGELVGHHLPVPDGFVVLTSAYNRFMQSTGLSDRIATALSSFNNRDVDALNRMSETITGWITGEALPAAVTGCIGARFDRLGAALVAVRSSANAEDSAGSAWAGQLDTFLGVTRETLPDHLKRCWASLFTPRALAYRFQNDLMAADISVAVVIQEMVASEVSGVAFSIHPVTQDHDQMVIEAGFGLGEAVVSGMITPDSYVIRRSDLEIVESFPSQQARGLFLKPDGGIEWRDLPGWQPGQPKLTPAQIRDLAELILRIESAVNYPCDIEWAKQGDSWHILQCRPITTLT